MFRFSASSTVRVRVISGRSGIFLFSSGSWDTIRTLTKYKILFHILDPLHCMLKTCCSVYYYAPCTFNPQIALSGVLCSLPCILKLLYQGYYAPYLESPNCSIRGIMLPTLHSQTALSGVLCSLPLIPKLLYQGYHATYLQSPNCSIRGIMLPSLNPQSALLGVLCSDPTLNPQIALSGVLCSLPWIPKLLYSGYNAPYLESQNCSIRGIMLPTLNPQIALSGVLCSLPLRISKTKVTVSPSTLNHSYKNIPL